MASLITHLQCSNCDTVYSHREIYTTCPKCEAPLLVQYGICHAKDYISKDLILSRPPGLWRWEELLPVQSGQYRATLGEGNTPIITLPSISHETGVNQLYLKDESRNQTASMQARGICVSICKAHELGAKTVAMASAGNTAGALASYAAYLGISAHVYMPVDAPELNRNEVLSFGAHLHLINGNISDACREVSEACQKNHWNNMTTLSDPYQLEGKKTIGYEIAEHFNWKLPDWILFPAKYGSGLIAIWKAFNELEELGWIGAERPHLAAIQPENFAPIVDALQYPINNIGRSTDMKDEHYGPIQSTLKQTIHIINENQGIAISVSHSEISSSHETIARQEGILCSPGGAATLAGLKHLLISGMIKVSDSVLLFNSAGGIKYL